MQCPGLHDTGPIHMWLLFCCVYHTILKKIITVFMKELAKNQWLER